MSLTPSTMLELGTTAPKFNLFDAVTGTTKSLNDLSESKALLVVFSSNHCPYAQHTMEGVVKLAQEYNDSELSIVCISSNDIQQYPQDAPEQMKSLAKRENYPFPYLYDETQQVAKAYTAACTPDFFLFDADQKLVYRGRFDASRPDNDIELTGSDLKAALDAVLAEKEVPSEQKPSIGCNIKWKQGNEPSYFG